MATTYRGYRFLGTTDDCTTCDCCGKANLKKTVVIMPLGAEGEDEGMPSYYGTTCAARALATTAKAVTEHAGVAERQRRDALEVAHRTVAKYGDFTDNPDAAVARYAANNPGYAATRTALQLHLEVARTLADAEHTLATAGFGPAA